MNRSVSATKSFFLLAMVLFGILSPGALAQVSGAEQSVGFGELPLILDAWVQAAELTASDAAESTNFGFSLSADGKTIVIGAPNAEANEAGAAYVFVEPANGWSTMTETAKLTASDGAFDDNFGLSVAMSGNTILVSAPNNNSGQGAVYVFVEPTGGWTTTTETAKLTASDGEPGDLFGHSVTVSGNVVAVGAYGFKTPGAAYVFVKPASGWATTSRFRAKLTASDGVADYFAASISLTGDTLAVGAPGATVGGNSTQGAAYVFVRSASGWSTGTETAKLTASDGMELDEFGTSVATTGATIVAGALYAMVGNTRAGAAYVFQVPTTGWATMTQTAKLTPGAAQGRYHPAAQFGYSLGLNASGNSVVAGAPNAFGPGGLRQGAAFLFVKPSTGWVTTSSSVKLVASDGGLGDEFGLSVGISGNTVVSGSLGRAADGPVYVFQRQP
jgi:hypothetical protein